MSDRTVYLAGPVDRSPDPHTWREIIQAKWPFIEWIDPAAQYPEYDGREAEVVEWCLQQAREADLLVVGIGSAGMETVGTHHEIAEAIAAGNRVAVVPAGDPSPFVRCREVSLFDRVEEAVGWLVEPAGGSR